MENDGGGHDKTKSLSFHVISIYDDLGLKGITAITKRTFP
jgi:hypothetical protein